MREGIAEGAAVFRRRHLRGVLCALTGAGLWGFSGACAQFLLANYDITPSFITAVRMLGAGAVFLLVLLVRNRAQLAAMLGDRRTLGQLAVFGGVGLFLCQITYTIVIGYTNAGTATVLQTTGIGLRHAVHLRAHSTDAAGARGDWACGRRHRHLAHRHAG